MKTAWGQHPSHQPVWRLGNEVLERTLGLISVCPDSGLPCRLAASPTVSRSPHIHVHPAPTSMHKRELLKPRLTAPCPCFSASTASRKSAKAHGRACEAQGVLGPPWQSLRKSIQDVSPEFIEAWRPSQHHNPRSVSSLRHPPRRSPGPGGMGVWPELTEGVSETMDGTCKRTLKTIKTRKCKKLLLLVRMLLSSALGNVLVFVMCFRGNKNVRKTVS